MRRMTIVTLLALLAAGPALAAPPKSKPKAEPKPMPRVDAEQQHIRDLERRIEELEQRYEMQEGRPQQPGTPAQHPEKPYDDEGLEFGE